MRDKSVLVVDDSLLSRMMLKSIIQQAYPSWSVVEAANANEALELVNGREIDVISLDMNMPGMTGIELAPLLQDKFPEAHIGIFTGSINPKVKEEADNLNLEFIEKPIDEEKVLAFVGGSE